MLIDYHTASLSDCPILQLPKVINPAGSLTALNNGIELSFAIKRVYYTYDIPCNAIRGGHAHKELTEILVAASGSFEVNLSDGKQQKTIRLYRPDQGLLIVPGIWLNLQGFSSGAVCLALASELFVEADYIYEYSNFLKEKR